MRRIVILLAAMLAFLPLAAEDSAVVRRIYVTRHGQPDLKKERPKLNSGDPLLSPLGQKQAACLGRYLKSRNFKGRIYASPYLRTVETAVLIGREMGLPVYPEACIQERVHDNSKRRKANSGEALPNLEKGGYTLAKMREFFGDGIAPDATLADDWLYRGEENWEKDHVPRIRKGLRRLLAAQPTGDILLVCHAGSVRGLNVAMTPPGGTITRGTGWNCCLFVYGQKADGSIVQLGYVKPETYLEPGDVSSNRKYKNRPEARKELDKPKKGSKK